ncbi:hypothetical protein [Bradyrhizobium sp. McL0615]|uniref:hypothetical protein n=1 Tax=Bradyrhizobium sp. McL0615 TaxID=3415673 RepID=UPI003CEB4090
MLLIEINKDDLEFVRTLADDQRLKYDVIRTDRFDGTGVDLVNVILPLSTAVLTSVTTIIVQLIRNRRRPKLKVDGVEVSDVSEDTINTVLLALIEKRSKREAKKTKKS